MTAAAVSSKRSIIVTLHESSYVKSLCKSHYDIESIFSYDWYSDI